METVLVVAQIFTAVAFSAAALGAFLRWREHRRSGNGWAALALGSLAVATIHTVVRDPGEIQIVERGILVAVVVTFPYLLFRFASSFVPSPPGVGTAAKAATLVVIAMSLVPGAVPAENGPRNGIVWLFLLAFLALWSVLLWIAASKLWSAGSEAPSVPKRRMQYLATATITLAVVLLQSLFLADRGPVFDLITRVLTIASGVVFYLGFAPPRLLRLIWRQTEQDKLQATIQTVVSSPTVEALAAELLPRTAELVAAEAKVLFDPDGSEVASYEDGKELPATRHRELPISIDLPHGGRLVVTPSHLAPFAADDIEYIRSVGALAILSIERSRIFERERESRAVAEAANERMQSEIAERRQAEEEAMGARAEAERANRAKSEFLSRMSHELRTPMNSIIGFGQLLQQDLSDPTQKENAEYILKAGRHLLDLINEVLDISRIEANAMTLSVEPVDVAEVVSEVTDLVQPLANERRVTLSLESDSDAGMYVAADRQRLKQVLLNLMSNAIKYNRTDGRVDIDYQVSEGLGVISIDDTGVGIAPEAMSQLFQPFQRLGAEASTVEGTGLGLALSKNLVTLMGGSIEVSSDESGSTFCVRLPVASVEEAELPKAGDFISIADRSEDPGCTVLYVEDNLTNLRLVERILGRRNNSSLLTAMQATLGIQLAKDHQPDLILMDLHLPDMSGEQALRILKGNAATARIPVVMLTADATPGRARRLKEQGAADYLTKPLDLAMFNQVIDRHAARPQKMATTA